MVCIYCGGGTGVINSRPQKRSNQIWRRRKCRQCRAIVTSIEAIDYATALTVASEGAAGPFIEDKLYSDLLSAFKHRKDRYLAAREAASTVTKELLKLPSKPLFTTKEISRCAGAVLSRLDKRAYLRFAAEHPSLAVRVSR